MVARASNHTAPAGTGGVARGEWLRDEVAMSQKWRDMAWRRGDVATGKHVPSRRLEREK